MPPLVKQPTLDLGKLESDYDRLWKAKGPHDPEVKRMATVVVNMRTAKARMDAPKPTTRDGVNRAELTPEEVEYDRLWNERGPHDPEVKRMASDIVAKRMSRQFTAPAPEAPAVAAPPADRFSGSVATAGDGSLPEPTVTPAKRPPTVREKAAQHVATAGIPQVLFPQGPVAEQMDRMGRPIENVASFIGGIGTSIGETLAEEAAVQALSPNAEVSFPYLVAQNRRPPSEQGMERADIGSAESRLLARGFIPVIDSHKSPDERADLAKAMPAVEDEAVLKKMRAEGQLVGDLPSNDRLRARTAIDEMQDARLSKPAIQVLGESFLDNFTAPFYPPLQALGVIGAGVEDALAGSMGPEASVRLREADPVRWSLLNARQMDKANARQGGKQMLPGLAAYGDALANDPVKTFETDPLGLAPIAPLAVAGLRHSGIPGKVARVLGDTRPLEHFTKKTQRGQVSSRMHDDTATARQIADAEEKARITDDPDNTFADRTEVADDATLRANIDAERARLRAEMEARRTAAADAAKATAEKEALAASERKAAAAVEKAKRDAARAAREAERRADTELSLERDTLRQERDAAKLEPDEAKRKQLLADLKARADDLNSRKLARSIAKKRAALGQPKPETSPVPPPVEPVAPEAGQKIGEFDVADVAQKTRMPRGTTKAEQKILGERGVKGDALSSEMSIPDMAKAHRDRGIDPVPRMERPADYSPEKHLVDAVDLPEIYRAVTGEELSPVLEKKLREDKQVRYEDAAFGKRLTRQDAERVIDEYEAKHGPISENMSDVFSRKDEPIHVWNGKKLSERKATYEGEVKDPELRAAFRALGLQMNTNPASPAQVARLIRSEHEGKHLGRTKYGAHKPGLTLTSRRQIVIDKGYLKENHKWDGDFASVKRAAASPGPRQAEAKTILDALIGRGKITKDSGDQVHVSWINPDNEVYQRADLAHAFNMTTLRMFEEKKGWRQVRAELEAAGATKADALRNTPDAGYGNAHGKLTLEDLARLARVDETMAEARASLVKPKATPEPEAFGKPPEKTEPAPVPPKAPEAPEAPKDTTPAESPAEPPEAPSTPATPPPASPPPPPQKPPAPAAPPGKSRIPGVELPDFEGDSGVDLMARFKLRPKNPTNARAVKEWLDRHSPKEKQRDLGDGEVSAQPMRDAYNGLIDKAAAGDKQAMRSIEAAVVRTTDVANKRARFHEEVMPNLDEVVADAKKGNQAARPVYAKEEMGKLVQKLRDMADKAGDATERAQLYRRARQFENDYVSLGDARWADVARHLGVTEAKHKLFVPRFLANQVNLVAQHDRVGPLMEWISKIDDHYKRAGTSGSVKSAMNNISGNASLYSAKVGMDMLSGAADMAAEWKRYKSPASDIDKMVSRGLKRGGVERTNYPAVNIDREAKSLMESAFRKARLGKVWEKLASPLADKATDAYGFVDTPPKVAVAAQATRRLYGYAKELNEGEHFTVAATKDRPVTITRTKNGWTLEERGRPKLVLDEQALVDHLALAGLTDAHGLFPDFANVAGKRGAIGAWWGEQVAHTRIVGASPFVSWAWRMVPRPGNPGFWWESLRPPGHVLKTNSKKIILDQLGGMAAKGAKAVAIRHSAYMPEQPLTELLRETMGWKVGDTPAAIIERLAFPSAGGDLVDFEVLYSPISGADWMTTGPMAIAKSAQWLWNKLYEPDVAELMASYLDGSTNMTEREFAKAIRSQVSGVPNAKELMSFFLVGGNIWTTLHERTARGADSDLLLSPLLGLGGTAGEAMAGVAGITSDRAAEDAYNPEASTQMGGPSMFRPDDADKMMRLGFASYARNLYAPGKLQDLVTRFTNDAEKSFKEMDEKANRLKVNASPDADKNESLKIAAQAKAYRGALSRLTLHLFGLDDKNLSEEDRKEFEAVPAEGEANKANKLAVRAANDKGKRRGGPDGAAAFEARMARQKAISNLRPRPQE